MRRILCYSSVILALAVSLTGCGQKAEQQATANSNDSLLSSNPVEQPAGNIAPQTDYQPTEKPAEPAPTPSESPAAPKQTTSHSTPRHTTSPKPAATGVTLESGAPINISVAAQLSSETASPGDSWTGEVKEPVIVGSSIAIPAGSRVDGVVSSVKGAERGSRAFLVLSVKSVTVNGETYDVSADADSIIAGSTRARNIGAVAGGAAAGALIGKVVGGGGKGALIGGLLGGAAATGAVAASKGYQVVVKEGTVITFNVKQSVKIRT